MRTISRALLSTALAMKTGGRSIRPASSRSWRIGLRSIGWPTMLKVAGVQLRLWLWATVGRPATPGMRFLYPPPKLAIRCGSMQPTDTTRSASATVLLSSTGVPRLVVPSETSRAASSQSGFSQCTCDRMLPPTLAAISCSLIGRCRPSAGTTVTSAGTMPAWASSAMIAAAMSAAGVGRLPSSTTSATRIPGCARSRSRTEPIGSARLRRISAPASATPGSDAGFSTPVRCQDWGNVTLSSSLPQGNFKVWSSMVHHLLEQVGARHSTTGLTPRQVLHRRNALDRGIRV